VARRSAEDRKIGRQQPVGVESEQRRQQHALREVARSAEEQQRVGSQGHVVLSQGIYAANGAGSNLGRRNGLNFGDVRWKISETTLRGPIRCPLPAAIRRFPA